MSMSGGFSDPAADIAAMVGAQPDPPPSGDSTEVPQPTITPEAQQAEEVVKPAIPPESQTPPPPEGGAPPVEEEEEEDDEVQLSDGSSISLERLRELAQLDHAFRADPTIQQTVSEAVARRGILPPPAQLPVPPYQPQAPQPQQPAPQQFPPQAPQLQLPPDVDPEDPVIRWTMTQLETQRQQFAQQTQAVATQLQQQQQASAAVGINLAREEIAKKYPTLTFDDMAAIEAEAARAGLGTHFLNTYGDPHRAAFAAMETAASTMGSVRPKILAGSTPSGVTPINSQADRARQGKLNALAGKGGTAPRNEPATPRKMTQAEKLSAMAQEIQAASQAN